jgi:5-methylcytosine-specific restriction endonuclease McrA
MPLRICTVPGCHELFEKSCPVHGGDRRDARERDRDDPARRIRSTKRWKRVRRAALARDGNRCTFGTQPGEVAWTGTRRGRCPVTIELDVHHIVSVNEDGAPYDLENTRTLCATHHGQVEKETRAA